MKKLWWFSRILAIAAAFYCIVAVGNGALQQHVKADEACDTGLSCSVDANGGCYCMSSKCTGCYIPNGGKNCGSCSGDAAILD